MDSTKPTLVRRLLILPPIALGVVAVVILSRQAREPERLPPDEIARDLHVIEIPSVEVMPRAIGYGTARPAQVWRAVSEVGGRVLEVHPNLRAGEFLQADEVAFRIDPVDYELTLKQIEAELAEMNARLAELATQSENDQQSLAIEQASLKIVQSEFQRIERLAQSGNAAPTELREAERALLNQRQAVQQLENAISLNTQKRATTEAGREVTAARLARSQRDLEKTVIRAPFACRLQDVKLEADQYVQAGQQLFEADGIDASEIDVQVPLGEVRKLVAAAKLPPSSPLSMEIAREALNLSAVVRVRNAGVDAVWEARFVRIREQIEPVTRTVQMVVAVDEPYRDIEPGKRPPLVRGAYCEVEMRAPSLTPHLVVPRASVFDGGVYVIDQDDRLRRKNFEPLFEQSDFVCVAGGLDPGWRLVVSDPRPAIEGQLVRPHLDEDVQRDLVAQASGQASVR